MDAFTSLLCLIVGSALPLAGLFVLLRRGMRQLAVAEAYGEVSRRLGLDVDTRGVSLHGHLDDQRIWVGQVMVGHGPERRHVTWGVLDLPIPLGMGLLLRRRGLSDRVFRRARRPEVVLADDGLERRLEVHGDDPSRVRALLDERVQEALDSMLKRWRDLVVTDHSVRVHLSQPLSRASELQELVDGLRRLADELDRARGGVPAPDVLGEWADAWRELGTDLDLTFDPRRHMLEGERDGHRVRLTAVRSPTSYATELKVFFGDHVGLGLLLRPQAGPGGYASVGQDIEVGETRFDHAFVVKGHDPGAVRELLGPEVRAALLQLLDAGPVEVDDKDLHVRELPLEPDALAPLVEAANLVANHMKW